MKPKHKTPILGLRENRQQFTLLLLTVGLVGFLVGLERTVVPLIGEPKFGLVSKTTIVSFIITLGVVKILCNFFAGHISESWGRKRVLVLSWLIADFKAWRFPAAMAGP